MEHEVVIPKPVPDRLGLPPQHLQQAPEVPLPRRDDGLGLLVGQPHLHDGTGAVEQEARAGEAAAVG